MATEPRTGLVLSDRATATQELRKGNGPPLFRLHSLATAAGSRRAGPKVATPGLRDDEARCRVIATPFARA
jgi:hypothetical protein